jgi:menaquinone-dependent protoporphyrinogen oxidase
MKVLIVYDTKHGATEEVAVRIADSVKARGAAAELLNLRDRGASEASVDGYDAVALGGPFYAGRWSRRALAFASAHETKLMGTRLGVFAVGADPKLGDAAAKAALPASLSSSIAASAYFGGRLDFARLGFLERLVIKAISGKAESSSTLDFAPAEAFGSSLAG